jgi:hypothetical protein
MRPQRNAFPRGIRQLIKQNLGIHSHCNRSLLHERNCFRIWSLVFFDVDVHGRFKRKAVFPHIDKVLNFSCIAGRKGRRRSLKQLQQEFLDELER